MQIYDVLRVKINIYSQCFLPGVEERVECIVELSALSIVVGLGIEVAEHSDVVLDVV